MYVHKLGGLSSKAKIATALSITLPILYYLSYRIQLPRHANPSWTPSWPTSWPGIGTHSTQSFADRWLAIELLEPFNASTIREYCAKSTWRPNLIFDLHGAAGGIGNLRAEMLDFVFQAIEAGAAIVLPGMTVRSDADLYDIFSGSKANFSRMFDERHFVSTLKEACPGMRVYHPEDILSEMIVDGLYEPRTRRQDWDAANTRAALHESVQAWLLSKNVDIKDASTRAVVHVKPNLWEIDTRSLPPEFRFYFPMLLRPNPAIRHFAGLAMANLASQYDVRIKPSDQVHEQAFYGAHLRTESDTVSAGWLAPPTEREYGLDFEAQTDAYLEHAEREELHIIYVATGNATEFSRFVDKAAKEAPHISIVSKFTLLDSLTEENFAALDELEWDQQALIDFEILKRCSVFGGFAKSSFSLTIAVARNAWLEDVMDRPWARTAWCMKEIDKRVAFDDGFSRILGRNELNEWKCPRGCWP